MRTEFHSFKKIVMFSLCCSCICTFTYLITLWAFLPPTDGAKQGGLLFLPLVLLNPLVLFVALPVATVLGLLGSIFTSLLLSNRNLLLSGTFIVVCTSMFFIIIH